MINLCLPIIYRMKKSLLLFLFVIVSFNGFSQQYVTTGDFDRLSKVTFGIGFNTYFGELRKAQDPDLQLGLSASIGYEHMFTDNIAIRTGFAVYKIQADDSLNRLPVNKTGTLTLKLLTQSLPFQLFTTHKDIQQADIRIEPSLTHIFT